MMLAAFACAMCGPGCAPTGCAPGADAGEISSSYNSSTGGVVAKTAPRLQIDASDGR